ncbi:sugar nucleotide-binding protein [Methylobacterium sp.]|uniref:sugar nucleotide-binding protein n=1 Tax=Methylobacterium sp. TaxID=409 RepID=UPI00261312A8|nr:sugar nucleotide-binding protein [Methylobacterium sp.]MDB5644978.1 dTDP-4-dehydrorhamnose reductase [Methylobacterium sp.]
MDVTGTPLELWGGFECTVARIGDRFRDQMRETGHRWRMADLDAVARLGLRTLRYPVLWETVAPHAPDVRDWSWHDARLAHLRRLGIDPIAGLLHHGSGPRYTNLLDPALPASLADHAGRVAARYPWLTRFTPVNEPLTTARFSGLYGHWYPHARSESAFLRMVVIQCKATVLAMRAIRRITPGARLIQTEDIGRTFSTPALAAQADYENARRWLSLDLLCGRIGPDHPWHRRLIENGVAAEDLALLGGGEGTPDIIGVNHYLTSERYLDGGLNAYPETLRGGNGLQPYADVEAVRVLHCAEVTGPAARLTETWERYGRPLAVTEVHHGCSRDEQLRWLAEVWDAAVAVRAEGVPVAAVTLWSLLGAVDWNSLLVDRAGTYEPGAFDIRAAAPRETALAKAARALATTGRFSHPVLDTPGWWRRASRLYAPPGSHTATGPDEARPILVLGADGALGRGLIRIGADRGLRQVGVAADGSDTDGLAERIAACRAWAVIDASGLDSGMAVRRYPGATLRVDAGRAGRVAAACARAGVPLVAFSSAHVFDGSLGRPAWETDPVRPDGRYGFSAAEAEAQIRVHHSHALIVRTGLVFDAPDPDARPEHVLGALGAAPGLAPHAPETLSLSYLPDLAHAALDLLVDGEAGPWHLVNRGAMTRDDFVAEVARALRGYTPSVAAPRPPILNRALTSTRGLIMPTRASALQRFLVAARAAPPLATRQAAE